MQYSLEESALIGGLIAEYFSRASVSESLRAAYRQVYQHLIDGHSRGRVGEAPGGNNEIE